MTKVTIPSPAERDELLKTFARALLRNDMDMLYRVVAPDFLWSFHDGLTITKSLAGSAAIREHLVEQKARYVGQRFHEVAYHHAADMTFMTFRLSETVRGTGEQREQCGVECYMFKDGLLATKDVYRKPVKPRPVTRAADAP
jgi:ketosteroid isomerase-like protein